MLWFFVALQALAPFIHAHAGAEQLHHAGFLHLHQAAVHGDAAWHAMAADAHGAEIAVAAGIPVRNVTQGVSVDASPAMALPLPCPDGTQRPGAGLPAPPLWLPALPDHALPHALAPPAV